MKLREIFRYELQYRLRSGATWAYAGILFLMAIWMFLATADGAGAANTPERIAGATILVSMFGLLVSAGLFGDAAVRDIEAGMDPLLFTTPLRKLEYLGGRFLGAIVVNAVVFIAIPLGILAATGLAATGAETFGTFRLVAHVEPYFTFVLPNLVLVGALLFTIGMLTRQTVPVYLAAIAIFIGTIVALNYVQYIDSPYIVAMVDPLGMASLMHVTETWTEAERSMRLVGLPGALAWNRVFWLAVAGALLVLLGLRFRFRHDDGGGRSGVRADVAAAPAERAAPVRVPRVAGAFGARTTLRQTVAVARNALSEVAASPWWAVVLVACAGFTMLWGWNVGDTVFDTSTWPVTLLVIESVLSSRNAPIIYVLIAVYAGELVWRERSNGSAQIVDAAPVPESAALAGRFLALAAMLVMFLAATMVGGLLIQALQGYYHFEIGLYLRAVFGMRLADYLLLAALAMTIHVLVNHKYVGHVVVVIAFLSPFILRSLRLVQHNLLLYGRDPGWMYSDMNGFGDFAAPFAWFKAYWGAWALLLLIIAILFWVRGYELGLRRRTRTALARFRGPVSRAAALAVVLILVFGGFIFYNTNILNEYRVGLDAAAPSAEYEKRYARFADTPQPTIAAVQFRAEIHPQDRALEISGAYRLENRTGVAIDALHVALDPDLLVRSLSVDRDARAAVVDDDLGYRIYELSQPLAPGESMRLAFDVEYRPRGFTNADIQTDVVGNGTAFNRMMMPFIGYQPMFELPDGEARVRLGLSPQEPTPGPDDMRARRHRWGPRDADLVDVDAVIGTASDQIAVTPGVLRRTWTENGRRHFHYTTETPIAFGGTVHSARYAVLEDRWNDVTLRIYHHPTHEGSLARMMDGMKASLEYFTRQFGPYPYSELNIVEAPRYGGFGVAHPHLIGFTEDVFFSRVRDGEVDQPFYGTAHEVAHTWWGGLVRGGAVRGAGFLSESLANYSAMLVTEKRYGVEAGEKVYDFQMERYLRGRTTQSREVPVLEVEDQPYIAYRKGAVALMTMRDLIGEDAVNGALRRYFERYRSAEPPFPSSRDLYAELRAVTPDSLRPLLADLFERVTLWDLETKRAIVQPAPTGGYIVTLEIEAKKVTADSAGGETEVPMDDHVEVGVFAPVEGGDDQREPLYLERHRIRSGVQTIRVTVPREPALAGVDPRGRLIERYREDNVIEVDRAER